MSSSLTAMKARDASKRTSKGRPDMTTTKKAMPELDETVKLVKAIISKENVKASKCLEDILKKKCSQKIADTLKS